MRAFITIPFILCAAIVSAQENSTDSIQTKPNNRIVLSCLGSTLLSEPLYVIDGILKDADSFKNINADNIVSISILKYEPGTDFRHRSNNSVIIVKTINGLTKKEKRKLKREKKKATN